MKTLYVSDLDGTLLTKQDSLSAFTVKTLNGLIDNGLLFSYATARSLSSASVVAKGLKTRLPVIVYNGAFLRDAKTGAVLSSCGFDGAQKSAVRQFLCDTGISPLVYAFVDGQERVSWLQGTENEGMRRYFDLRQGDRRFRCVTDPAALYAGDAFYFTCIGERQSLLPVYERFSKDGAFRCTIQQELYRPEYWCEIMPAGATKANALRRLGRIAGCDRIVTFGDAINDLPMFELSDACYAVENAVTELKEAATGVIASNERDGVAHWLLDHAEMEYDL
jgi:Predicted hydrolases of the HAD superfamily